MIRDAAVCMLNKPVLDRLAGGPICCDKNACRGRNVTDCAFGSSTQWRGLATRYDKHCLPRPPEGGAAR
jgi:hypothetical protein